MRKILLMTLAMACGSDAPTVVDAPACQQSLPPTDASGSAWPTYSAADATLSDCAQLDGFFDRRRGACADGKRFLEKGSGFVGDTAYFDGETLVGITRWTDILSGCTATDLGDADCEQTDVEEIRCPQ